MATKSKLQIPGYLMLVVDNGPVPYRKEETRAARKAAEASGHIRSLSGGRSLPVPVPQAGSHQRDDDYVQPPCDVE